MIDEISNYFLSSSEQLIFFKEILKKNNISLEFDVNEFEKIRYYEKSLTIERGEFSYTCRILDVPIEELDLSVRAYNCIKRAGINTLSDLVNKTEEEYMKVRNLGKKAYDEIIEKIKSLGLSLDEKSKIFTNRFTTIKIKYNNNSMIYKTELTSIRKIAESLFEILANECNISGIILNYDISTGLLMLLLKGYFYAETIAENYEDIYFELKQGGYNAYADEVKQVGEALKIHCEIQNKTKIRIIKIDTKIARKIINNKPSSLDELLFCCDSDDIELNEFYKSVFEEEFKDNFNIVYSEQLNPISNEEILCFDEENLIIEKEYESIQSSVCEEDDHEDDDDEFIFDDDDIDMDDNFLGFNLDDEDFE